MKELGFTVQPLV